MRALQYPVSKRSVAWSAVALLALFMLCMTAQAHAESSVYNHPRTNVVLGCGIDSEPTEPVRLACEPGEVYRNGEFEYIRSANFGYLEVVGCELAGESSLKLNLVPHEQIVAIETRYGLPGGKEINFHWNGKGNLPLYRRFSRHKAFLFYVNVGIHSPKLPNQPPEPKYTGTH